MRPYDKFSNNTPAQNVISDVVMSDWKPVQVKRLLDDVLNYDLSKAGAFPLNWKACEEIPLETENSPKEVQFLSNAWGCPKVLEID